MFSGSAALPSLEAVTCAEPPPTAVSVAPSPLGCTFTTRLFVVDQETGRSVKSTPLVPTTLAVTCSASPRFIFNGPELVATAPSVTPATGQRREGSAPGFHSIVPPWKDW